MANPTLEKINYQIGRLCRLSTRKAKLMAISNRRKQQLRHLGERIYIFKALQQDEDIWEKDEISQLLLTIADLDQEQEMLIDEINEIKAENPPETIETENQEVSSAPDSPTAAEGVVSKPAPKAATKAPEVKKEVKKKAVSKPEKKAASATAPKAPRKKAAPSKSKAKVTKES